MLKIESSFRTFDWLYAQGAPFVYPDKPAECNPIQVTKMKLDKHFWSRISDCLHDGLHSEEAHRGISSRIRAAGGASFGMNRAVCGDSLIPFSTLESGCRIGAILTKTALVPGA